MAIDNIWVFAQGADGAPTTGTLELLTKARCARRHRRRRSSPATPPASPPALGEYGATKVYATGDLGGKLPGVAVRGGDEGRHRRRRRARPDPVPAELRGPRRR